MKTIIEKLKKINKPRYKGSLSTFTLGLFFIGSLTYFFHLGSHIHDKINSLVLTDFVAFGIVFIVLANAIVFAFYEMLENIDHNLSK